MQKLRQFRMCQSIEFFTNTLADYFYANWSQSSATSIYCAPFCRAAVTFGRQRIKNPVTPVYLLIRMDPFIHEPHRMAIIGWNWSRLFSSMPGLFNEQQWSVIIHNLDDVNHKVWRIMTGAQDLCKYSPKRFRNHFSPFGDLQPLHVKMPQSNCGSSALWEYS